MAHTGQIALLAALLALTTPALASYSVLPQETTLPQPAAKTTEGQGRDEFPSNPIAWFFRRAQSQMEDAMVRGLARSNSQVRPCEVQARQGSLDAADDFSLGNEYIIFEDPADMDQQEKEEGANAEQDNASVDLDALSTISVADTADLDQLRQDMEEMMAAALGGTQPDTTTMQRQTQGAHSSRSNDVVYMDLGNSGARFTVPVSDSDAGRAAQEGLAGARAAVAAALGRRAGPFVGLTIPRAASAEAWQLIGPDGTVQDEVVLVDGQELGGMPVLSGPRSDLPCSLTHPLAVMASLVDMLLSGSLDTAFQLQMAAARQQQRQSLMLASLSDQFPQQREQQGQAYSAEYVYEAGQQQQREREQNQGPLVITWFSTTTTSGPYTQEEPQQVSQTTQTEAATSSASAAGGNSNDDGAAASPSDSFWQLFEDNAPMDLDMELPPLTLSDLSLFDSTDGSLRMDVVMLLALLGACMGMMVGVMHSWCALRRVMCGTGGVCGSRHAPRSGLLVPLLMADGEQGYILVSNPAALTPAPHSPSHKSLTAPQPAFDDEKAAAQAEWAARHKAKLQAASTASTTQQQQEQQQADVPSTGLVVAADHVSREHIAGARNLQQ